MKRIVALNRNILLYRLLLVFGANGLMTPVIYFFFTSTKNLPTAQSLFLIGFVALAKAVSEVPTGIVADKFSRKYSILIGYTLLVVSWLGLLVLSGFWQLLLLTVILGIGGSFISGADDALLYDSLKELKTSDKFKSILSFSQSIELVAFALTIFVGGVLGGVNLYFPVFVNIIFLCLSIVLSSLLIEPLTSVEGEKIEQKGYLIHAKRSFTTIFSHSGFRSGLFSAFVSFVLLLAVFKSTKNILTPILDSYGFSVSVIGFTISGVMLVKALGAFIASKYSKPGNELKEAIFSLVSCIVGLILIAVIQIPLVKLIIFIAILGLDNVILTNFQTLVNEKINSSQRATILSLFSLFARSTEMLFLTSFGWIIGRNLFNLAIVFTACWLAVALFITLIFTKTKRKIDA